MMLDEAIKRVQDRLCCVLTDDVRKETIAMRGFLLELKAYREKACREAASKDEENAFIEQHGDSNMVISNSGTLNFDFDSKKKEENTWKQKRKQG